jgi:hypothetical protein
VFPAIDGIAIPWPSRGSPVGEMMVRTIKRRAVNPLAGTQIDDPAYIKPSHLPESKEWF